MSEHPTADYALAEWARYTQIPRDYGLGYPHECVIGRMVREGASAGHRSPHVDAWPAHVEIVERVLVMLPQVYRRITEEVYQHGRPQRQVARRLRISQTSLRAKLSSLQVAVTVGLGLQLPEMACC